MLKTERCRLFESVTKQNSLVFDQLQGRTSVMKLSVLLFSNYSSL